MDPHFSASKANGETRTCKFCHADVWLHKIEGRYYDVGGETVHIDNCKRKQEHFRSMAMDAAETRRQKRKR